MKNYEIPSAFSVDSMTEGVYMESGDSSTDCWEVGCNSVQDWNGSEHIFEASAIHSTSVVHITQQVTYTFTFSAPVEHAYSEFGSSYSGNTVVVIRDLHANGYHSGDKVTFKVWVRGADEATTKAMACTGVSYVCSHMVNVQGGYD